MTEMSDATMIATARRLHELVAPIHEVAYSADEPDEELRRFGFRTYWDGYFAGRGAPLGTVPAEVVDAVFYNFARGEVARHIPSVWEKITPEEALDARERGCTRALRRILGDRAGAPSVSRAADILIKAGTSAPVEGRPLYAGLRTLPIPDEPLARLWHGATLLREYRGDGHNAALVCAGIGRTEAHVLAALWADMRAEDFGRISHLPTEQLSDVIEGLRARGLIDESGWLSETGREIKDRIETLTDELSLPAYAILEPAEIDQLIIDLEPFTAAIIQSTQF